MLVTSHQPVRRREILEELSYRCQGLPSSDPLPPVKLSYIAAIYHNRVINMNHVFKHTSLWETVHIHTLT